MVWVSGPENLARVRETDLRYAFLVLGATVGIIIPAALRWDLVLRALLPGYQFPLGTSLRVVLLGLALGQVTTTDVGSASSRLVYLTQGRQVPLGQASYSVLLDRWLDVLVLLLLIPASALALPGILSPAAALLLMGIASGLFVVLAARWPTMVSAPLWWGIGVATFLLKRVLKHRAAQELGIAQRQLGAADLARAFGLSFARMFFVGIRTWLVLLAVGSELSFGDLWLLLPLAQATLLVPITPGGLGIYEAGWYGILIARGVSPEETLLFVVLNRVLSVVALLIITAASELASLLVRRRRQV